MARVRGRIKVPTQAGRFPSTNRSRGRPKGGTLYRPEFCDRVIEYGKCGWSEAEMAFNGFGVTRKAMRDWAKNHEEFGEALAAAHEASQSWWESMGRMHLKHPKFNTNLYNKIMSCRFRQDYSDRVVVAGDEDQPVITRIERRIVRT